MAHLGRFRKGWENEHLARFLLSQISFLSQPITIADDIGVDFVCTLFEPQVIDRAEQLLPKQSFAIQVKSSNEAFSGEKHLAYYRDLQLPFFVGVIERDQNSLQIFSGAVLPDFFSHVRENARFHFCPRPDIRFVGQVPDWQAREGGQDEFDLLLPLVCSLKADSCIADQNSVRELLGSICTMTMQNIAARVACEYVFQYPVGVRIQAGTGSINTFRRNFMFRLAEVFYNLSRIRDQHPEQFSEQELQYFEDFYRNLGPDYPRDFVDLVLRKMNESGQ